MRRVNVRRVSAVELEQLLPSLVDLLWDAVDAGGSLGFLPPLADDEGRAYWRSLLPELERGSRILLAAFVGERMVGSVQLALSPWRSSPYRAEVHKLFVATSLKGRGIGKALLGAVHEEARQRGRSLLVLNARFGDPAAQFYRGQGYREAGVIPGYSLGPAGERFDNLIMYREI
jgi:GNAT superfamily N-acetyltransferase